MIDGVTTNLLPEPEFGFSFSQVFTDPQTGKKIEVSGIIPKRKPTKNNPQEFDSIAFSFKIPSDSVLVTDSTKTVKLKPIEQEKGFFDGITLKEIGLFILGVVCLAFLISLLSLFKKQ